MNWRDYWNQLAARESDPRRQVARVKNNRDLGPEDSFRLVEHLRQLLALKAEDRLLDLCCGNGLITASLADQCREVTGIDLSENMIEAARASFSRSNVTYLTGNVTEAAKLVSGPFDKIVLQFSFQYLSFSQGKAVISTMKSLLAPEGIIVLGDVPDASLIRNFYPDLVSLFRYRIQRLRQTDQMGKFWSEKELRTIAPGMRVERLPQPADLPYHEYRVDYQLRFS